jgi:hypothetical protein
MIKMFKRLGFCLALFLLFLTSAHSNSTKIEYDKIDIPGAVCGSGLQYHVFVHKDSKQDDGLMLYLESGGACWNWHTCWGPNFRTWIHPLPFPRLRLDKFSKKQVFKNHTSVIFPYCTGDIFAADYKAKYKVHHVGKKNLKLTMDYLIKENIINPSQFEKLVVSGSSAGAIGALINANMFESYFPMSWKKTLIMDSPGFHWGQKFWNKFAAPMIQQFEDSTAHILNDITGDGGMVIRRLPEICQHFIDWNVGILQSTKDIIMSGLFGNISPKKHKQYVYGPQGVYQQSLMINNCSAWAPDSYGHAFLQLDPLKTVKAGDINSIEFVELLLNGHTLHSYRD